MELKLVQWQWKEDLFKLLIVPYGIETALMLRKNIKN